MVFALAHVQAEEHVDVTRVDHGRAPPVTLSSGLASAPSCHTHVTESSSGSGEAGAQAPHQRSVDASGPGDTTPRIINNKGGEVMPDPKAGSPIVEPRKR
ncbi:hypothetical protein GCM10010329_81630 [Streptomyces spiroverticillatus]|uniref:Uncharacterized protein n=1 Tax=Streptomyces finlayi TaxID=67296 RepID=A0A918X8H5_9ACTN|nr:hypothetical protein GCM10010329_81630 [Streptomyces spiroverticillatus]GHD18199.1 hypothetical protein GCM10010334_80710 [Streptomyces finlayi]